jgi:CheY-like chemotaxis protein
MILFVSNVNAFTTNLKHTEMKTPKSILLIEDDIEDQEFFLEAVSEIENACIYHVAGNGKEALDRLQQSSILPDLIFSDVNMPFMNGIECLSEIKMNPRTKNIPVFILSSAVNDAAIVRELGARAFIVKPNSSRILRQQIEKIINENFTVAAEMPASVMLPLRPAA